MLDPSPSSSVLLVAAFLSLSDAWNIFIEVRIS